MSRHLILRIFYVIIRFGVWSTEFVRLGGCLVGQKIVHFIGWFFFLKKDYLVKIRWRCIACCTMCNFLHTV